MTERVETVIVGAGQAGLAMSHWLRQMNREHVILERARVGERWRSERWDSLRFQFPNWMIRLPGCSYDGPDPDAFMPRDGVVAFIERYARLIDAPVRSGVEVRELSRPEPKDRLWVETSDGRIEADHVVIAAGPYQRPNPPAFADKLAPAVLQVVASRYRNPGDLPDGSVLVVGSGASGYQIAEDLLASGRRVYLSIGRHRRVPRRYRGRDFGWWQERTGLAEVTSDRLPPNFLPPLLTGIDGGKDANLRALAKAGLTLLGSLAAVEGAKLAFAADLDEKLREGDAGVASFKRTVDAFVAQRGLDAPLDAESREEHPGSLPAPPSMLDARDARLGCVIWATGYRYDFGWIRCPVLDPKGAPVHRRGVTGTPGLYFLGLPRLHKVKSSFLWGCGEDALHLAKDIHASSCAPRPVTSR